MPFAIGAYSTTPAPGHKIERRLEPPARRERYYLLLKSLDPLCDKSIVARLPELLPQKSFAALELRAARLWLADARGLGVL